MQIISGFIDTSTGQFRQAPRALTVNASQSHVLMSSSAHFVHSRSKFSSKPVCVLQLQEQVCEGKIYPEFSPRAAVAKPRIAIQTSLCNKKKSDWKAAATEQNQVRRSSTCFSQNNSQMASDLTRCRVSTLNDNQNPPFCTKRTKLTHEGAQRPVHF